MEPLTPEEATKIENQIVREFTACMHLWAKRENKNFSYDSHPQLLLQVIDKRHLGREVLVNRVPVFRTWRITNSAGKILGVGSRAIVGDWEAE